MKKGLAIAIAFLWMLASVATVSCAEDYLVVPEDGSKITPAEEVHSGDPVAANVTLYKKGILPREAVLFITLNLANPEVKLTVDSKVESFSKQARIAYPLPEGGVNTINIRISGDAPQVSKRVYRDIVDITTFTYYDAEHQENQTEKVLSLYVTNPVAEEAYSAIITARERLEDADFILSALEGLGANTVQLRVEYNRIEEQIDIAESSNAAGRSVNAKRQASLALASLEDLISEAKTLEVGTQQASNIKRYMAIGFVLVVIFVLVILLKGYKEELG